MTPPGRTSTRESAAIRFRALHGSDPQPATIHGEGFGTALFLIFAVGISAAGFWLFGFDWLLESLLARGRLVLPEGLLPFFSLVTMLAAAVLGALWICLAQTSRSDRPARFWIGVLSLLVIVFLLRAYSGPVHILGSVVGLGLIVSSLIGLGVRRIEWSRDSAVEKTATRSLASVRIGFLLCLFTLGASWMLFAFSVDHSSVPAESAVDLPVGGALRAVRGPWSSGRDSDLTHGDAISSSSSASLSVDGEGQVVEALKGGGQRIVQPASRSLGAVSALAVSREGRAYMSAESGGTLAQLHADGRAVPVAKISTRFGEVQQLAAIPGDLLRATTDRGYGFIIELPQVDAGYLDFPESAVQRAIVGSVTENTATLGWVTKTAHRGAISIWSDGKRAQRMVEPAAVHAHSISLADLPPDRVHHFTIETPSGASHVQHFRTLPAPRAEPEWTMAVVADPQFDGAASRRGQYFARAVEAMNASDVDFVVIAGDLVDHRNREGVMPDFTGSLDDSRALFREFKEIASRLEKPWYVAVGNHEHLERPGVRAVFLEEFGLERAYYGIDLGTARFLFLEGVKEQGWRPDPAQMVWLRKELETHADRDVFVITHYAVVDDPFVFDRDRGRMPEVQALLESHGRVRAVYNGHKNVISATSKNGILYVTTPSPSAAPHGYFRVRAYKDGLLQNFVSTPGAPLWLGPPRMVAGAAPNPAQLRHDSLYRWGRPEARNFAWTYPRPDSPKDGFTSASTSHGGTP